MVKKFLQFVLDILHTVPSQKSNSSLTPFRLNLPFFLFLVFEVRFHTRTVLQTSEFSFQTACCLNLPCLTSDFILSKTSKCLQSNRLNLQSLKSDFVMTFTPEPSLSKVRLHTVRIFIVYRQTSLCQNLHCLTSDFILSQNYKFESSLLKSDFIMPESLLPNVRLLPVLDI